VKQDVVVKACVCHDVGGSVALKNASASPTDFICVVSVLSASSNFSNVQRSNFTTTQSIVGSKRAGVSPVMSLGRFVKLAFPFAALHIALATAYVLLFLR